LVDRLNDKGFEVTQASVSRDLVELGVIKANGKYSAPRDNHVEGLGKLELNVAGENLIIAKCRSGLASAFAVRIDAAGIGEIVGTIAGDDTIFIAVNDSTEQRRTMKKLLEVMAR
jgi:transcriptional regulator of arginine metabolism